MANNPIVIETMRNGVVYKGFVPLVNIDQIRQHDIREEPPLAMVIVWFDGEPDLYAVKTGDSFGDNINALERYYLDEGWTKDRIRFHVYRPVVIESSIARRTLETMHPDEMLDIAQS